MTRRIEAVLFDADGVMQRRPRGWKDALGERLGFRGEPDVTLAQRQCPEGSMNNPG